MPASIAKNEMHTGKMTVEQAVEFFVKERPQVRPVAEKEAKRGTSDPTYLVYTLGKLQIMKLREVTKRRRARNSRRGIPRFVHQAGYAADSDCAQGVVGRRFAGAVGAGRGVESRAGYARFLRRSEMVRGKVNVFAKSSAWSSPPRRPLTRENSCVLLVTRTAPRLMAVPAMSRSKGPMTSPRVFRSRRMRAASRAAS